MAEEKGKDKGGGGSRVPHPAEPVIALLIIATIGGAIATRLTNLSSGASFSSGTDTLLGKILSYRSLFELVSVITTAILFTIVFILARKIGRIRYEEKKKLYPPDETEADDNVVNSIVNKKWERVEAHIQSKNPSDWRLAIIEADIMLDELLDVLNYRGDSIGDKLKVIEKSDFLTLDAAWEAHKIRNEIAHKGSTFDLNEREAVRVISLYKSVFDEFELI